MISPSPASVLAVSVPTHSPPQPQECQDWVWEREERERGKQREFLLNFALTANQNDLCLILECFKVLAWVIICRRSPNSPISLHPNSLFRPHSLRASSAQVNNMHFP